MAQDSSYVDIFFEVYEVAARSKECLDHMQEARNQGKSEECTI